MTKIKYTIAIPIYNGDKTLFDAITSCLQQSFIGEYEVLLLDDASIDNSRNVIEQFHDFRIKYISLQKRVSLFETHNLCLKYGKGKYLMYCHQDDKLFPEALEKIDSILSKHDYPDKIVLFGRSFFRDFSDNWNKGGLKYNFLVGSKNVCKAFLYGGLAPSGVCYSRRSFLLIKGFLLDKGKLASSDSSTMIKLVYNKYSFYMSDSYFINRKTAGTCKKYKIFKLINSFYLSLKELKKCIGVNEYNSIVDMSFTLKYPPVFFWLCTLPLSRYKIKLCLFLFKSLFCKPLLLNILRNIRKLKK